MGAHRLSNMKFFAALFALIAIHAASAEPTYEDCVTWSPPLPQLSPAKSLLPPKWKFSLQNSAPLLKILRVALLDSLISGLRLLLFSGQDTSTQLPPGCVETKNSLENSLVMNARVE